MTISSMGMNIGTGGDYSKSGELESLVSAIGDIEEPVIFDVGSHEGEWFKLVRSISKDAYVYSFEPSLASFKKLVKENINSFNIALSDVHGKSELHSDKQGSGLSSVYKRKLDHFNINFNEKHTIDTDTLDRFCERNGIEHIDLLKMDIEGHELKVLHGSKEMLKNIDRIQFEFGGCDIDSRTFFQDFWYLLYKDFRIYRILSHGIFEIKEYSEDLEVFRNTNYIAIRKGI